MCEWCGKEHEIEEPCEILGANFYFVFTDFPKKFDWANGTIESYVVPCHDQSEVDLMTEYVRKGLDIAAYASSKLRPMGVSVIEVASGGMGVTFIKRWAPALLREAYAWYDNGHRRKRR